MHEMGIAMQIIEIAQASIPETMKSVRIGRVNLKIGRMSAVMPDSLRLCFEVAAKDTQLDGAELVVEEIPVVARCQECDAEWVVSGPAFTCERCQSGKIDIVSGRELDIVSLEVAD